VVCWTSLDPVQGCRRAKYQKQNCGATKRHIYQFRIRQILHVGQKDNGSLQPFETSDSIEDQAGVGTDASSQKRRPVD